MYNLCVYIDIVTILTSTLRHHGLL